MMFLLKLLSIAPDCTFRVRSRYEDPTTGEWVSETEVVETAKAQIADAVKVAEARENPAASTLFDDVYMNLTPQLKAQRQELADLIAKGGVGADIGHFPL